MKVLQIVSLGLLAFSAEAQVEPGTYGQRIVAAVLMGEARGEGEVGLKAVAEVVHNRAVQHAKSPLTVVCEKGAFSCLNGKTPDQLYRKHSRSPLFKAALQIAQTVYNSPDKLPGTTRGATFYDLKGATPPWLSAVRLVAIIGHHAFYVEKGKALIYRESRTGEG